MLQRCLILQRLDSRRCHEKCQENTEIPKHRGTHSITLATLPVGLLEAAKVAIDQPYGNQTSAPRGLLLKATETM